MKSIEDRKKFSLIKVDELRAHFLDKFPTFAKSNLTIYVTGSFGREEASENSDLDAFFLTKGSYEAINSRITPVNSALIFADVIRSTEAVNLPNFTNEGEYLEFHYVEDVLKRLGGRNEDHLNSFTARMLMILEAKYLFNEQNFRESREKIVDCYFRDFQNHEGNFRPTFLINDILRFWRTLCLNYEHGRTATEDESGQNAKEALKNLKLKFSRLNTCFSFIARVLGLTEPIDSSSIIKICDETPIARLSQILQTHPVHNAIISDLIESYMWFLAQTYPPKDEVLKWLTDSGARHEAFAKAKLFGDKMFELIRPLAEKNNTFRYLVI
jgi:Nucleotidyltransferase domain